MDAKSIERAADSLKPKLVEVATRIHENPELRFEEHKAAGWLCDALEESGAEVERGLGDLPTAFRARTGKTGGARVAILAEYDALPEIGHACGHNLIAAGALGAFLALAKNTDSLAGSVEIIGTPAEEGGGGKIRLLEAGVFEGIDAAMMFHPFDRDLSAHLTLASNWLVMTFRGTPSHAAIAPWDGASALTACLETFRLVDSQRVHFRDGVRVHGFVIDGGQAVNIIVERSVCEFSVRALDMVELQRVQAIVERCAKGAALACGVEVEIEVRQGYKNMVNNLSMARRFAKHLSGQGRHAVEVDPTVGAGSTDMGDISHAVPSIHPWIAICDRDETTCHQHAFAKCAVSQRGMDSMLDAAKAMALTACDILEDESLRDELRSEFQSSQRV